MLLQNYYVYTCMYLQEHQCTSELLEIYWEGGVSLGFPTSAQINIKRFQIGDVTVSLSGGLTAWG